MTLQMPGYSKFFSYVSPYFLCLYNFQRTHEDNSKEPHIVYVDISYDNEKYQY